jgi:broad specificity polyphosphatase/5'/3'-nucleotidase SurE
VRKVCPLVHIILRSVFAVTFSDVSIAKKQLLSIGVKPKIYHTRSEHTNDHTNDAVLVNNEKKTYLNINIPDMRIDKFSVISTPVQYLVQ